MPAETRRGPRRVGLGLATALVILAADQVSKWWIRDGLRLPDRGPVVLLPVLDFHWTENRGVTFGLLNGTGTPRLLLAAVALAVVALLGVWLWRAESRLVAVALGAIAGGAIGNVIDRLRFGWVVDFIDVHAGNWHWYVFNLADAAIVCGVAALAWDGLRPAHKPDARVSHQEGKPG